MSNIVRVELGRFTLGFDTSQALDLRHLWIDGVNLAPGMRPLQGPDPVVNRALEGLIFTCGADHIRQPCRIGVIDWPLHGNLIRNPSSQPKVHRGGDLVTVSACTTFMSPAGCRVEVKRRYRLRISAGLEISIDDQVTNLGPTPMRPMMMYHINFRSDLFGQDTTLNGARLASFAEESRTCTPAPARTHLSPLEGNISIDVDQGSEALPWLQVWRRSDILAIEPASHPMVDREEIERQSSTVLDRGASSHFALKLRIQSTP